MSEEKKPDASPASDDLDKLEPLIPLAKQFLINQSRELESREKLQEKEMEISEMQAKRNFEYDNKSLEFERHKYDRQFWLLLFITAIVLGTAVGLIFLQRNVEAGILLLTHVVTLIIGLIGGAGWHKANESDE